MTRGDDDLVARCDLFAGLGRTHGQAQNARLIAVLEREELDEFARAPCSEGAKALTVQQHRRIPARLSAACNQHAAIGIKPERTDTRRFWQVGRGLRRGLLGRFSLLGRIAFRFGVRGLRIALHLIRLGLTGFGLGLGLGFGSLHSGIGRLRWREDSGEMKRGTGGHNGHNGHRNVGPAAPRQYLAHAIPLRRAPAIRGCRTIATGLSVVKTTL